MTLGERLKDYRQKNNLSQEQLAETLHVSRQAVTKWESDRGVPDIDNLLTISRVLGASLDELVGEERIKQRVATQREGALKQQLSAAILFLVASVCWLVAGATSIGHTQTVVTILNFCSSIGCAVAAGFQIKRYYELKQ